MGYSTRVIVLLLLDSIFVTIAVLSSYLIRTHGLMTPQLWLEALVYAFVSMICIGLCFYASRLYQRVWRYASIGELVTILKSTVLGSVLAYVITSLFIGEMVSYGLALRKFETVLLLVGGSRFIWRITRDNYVRKRKKNRQALIIGAGDCGSIIVKEMRTNSNVKLYPAAFIDDNPAKLGLQVNGVKVIGDRSFIPKAVEQLNIDDIIIAMPSVSRREISNIIDLCKGTTAQTKIVPELSEIFDRKVSLKSVRNVQVEDLLGRDPVKVDLKGIANYIENKVVLVTGAGGSIGSELCRQIAFFKPTKILLLGHGENSIYQIGRELAHRLPHLETESIIADVQDKRRIERVFQEHRPEVVFHAAAHKHVPLMELNPSEAIKNNVFGTKNVAECADQYGVERFVLISTDKAVNPTSIMGATKRIAEMVVQGLNVHSKTRFAAVRFGNVLGSRGSVVPLFKEQIDRGGPVTVTHPEMTRYFMTIPEAVQLVIQAGAYSEGGEVFVLDMGQPVNINSLAEDLIRFTGLEPYVDIEIQYTGVRPGEKLYEELLTEEEGLTSTMHNRIFVGKSASLDRKAVEFELKRLEQVISEDQNVIRDILKLIVPSYQNVS